MRKKYDERPDSRGEVAVMVETTSSTTGERRKLPMLPLLAGGAFFLVAAVAASYTSVGAAASMYVFAFLNFFAGVFTLVALSITVMAGLVATDRIFLKIGHRVLFQGLHRATAVIAMVTLGLHVAMKIMAGTATVLDPFVPFGNLANPLYVGLGTIAGYLMISVFWTGIIRARFAGSGRPWMWRAMHSGAYLAWPIALFHGLNAGRPAATWVVLSYGACIAGVAIGLLVRLYVMLGRRTTGTTIGPKAGMAAVGVNVETAVMPRFTDTGSMRAIREQEPVSAMPASAMPASAMPASAMPASAVPTSAPVSRETRVTPRDTSWKERTRETAMPRDTWSETPRERDGWTADTAERSRTGRARQGYAVPPSDETGRTRVARRRDAAEPAAGRVREAAPAEPRRGRDDAEPRRGRDARGAAPEETRRGRDADGRRGRDEPRQSRTDRRRRARAEVEMEETNWYESLRDDTAPATPEPEYASRSRSGRRSAADPEPGYESRSRRSASDRESEYESRGRSGRRSADAEYAPESRSARRAADAEYAPESRSTRRAAEDEYAPRRSEGRRRGEQPAERWTSPADERYGVEPVSSRPISSRPISSGPVSGDRWDTPVSGARWDADQPVSAGTVSGARWEDETRQWDRAESADEDRPRRMLRLVRDSEGGDAPRGRSRSRSRSEAGRHGADEYEMDQPRERRGERLGPYPPAPARPAEVIDSSDRSRRGRRAAGGEDLDAGDGAYWTRPRGGYGR